MRHSFIPCLCAAGLAWLPLQTEAKPERPAPDLLFIENADMKLGMDRSMGASITWLSWKEHPGNVINIHDPGRLLQQSYYAGQTIDRQKDGQSKHWSPWSWNPIQGGGVMSWARVTRFEKTDPDTILAITIPKLWDMPDEEAEAIMQQRARFHKDMPNVVEIRNRLICQRKDNDAWGSQARDRHQELPAAYFTSAFRHFECYLGKGQWQKVQQPPGPPWGKTTPPLNIMACFNDAGQGVAIYSPVANAHWNFGPHRNYDPKAGPTDGPCVHMAPIAKVPLGPKSTLEYRYWIIGGSRDAIVARLDPLMKLYAGEKFQLSNP